MKKIVVLLFIPCVLLSFSFARYCNYNSQGNYHCSNDDGTYEYWNQDGSYYHSSYGYTPPSSYSRSYTYYSYCPAHSHKYGDSCLCNKGYKTNYSKTACIKDWDYHCNSKYPGTIYRSYDKMCIYPGDGNGGSSWSNKYYCEKPTYVCPPHSHESGKYCVCDRGYTVNYSKSACIKY